MSHLILDIGDVLDKHNLIEILDRICKKYSFNILNRYYHKFKPQGETLVYALSESHMSIHTYPEITRVAIDLYCCKPNFENEMHEIKNELVREFEGIVIRSMIINRPC